MKELLAIEEELKEIIEAGKQKTLEHEAEIETAKNNEEEANRAVVRAKQGDDPEAYAKAIADKRTASDIACYYEGKIEEIRDEPYITEDEYKEYSKRIKAEMDAIINEVKAKASRLLKELEAIKEEVSIAHGKANNLLAKLQNKIYKDTYDKAMENTRKNKIPFSWRENKYSNYSLLNGLYYILDSPRIKEIIEEGKGRK